MGVSAKIRSTEFAALGHAGPDHYAGLESFADDVAAALELPADAVRVELEQKARGGITITARV